MARDESPWDETPPNQKINNFNDPFDFYWGQRGQITPGQGVASWFNWDLNCSLSVGSLTTRPNRPHWFGLFTLVVRLLITLRP